MGAVALLVLLGWSMLRVRAEFYYVRISFGIGGRGDFDRLERLGAVAVPVLVRLLRARDAVDRDFAAETLGRLGAAEAVDALVDLARSDPDQNVRGGAIGALARIADPRALPSMHELARTDSGALSALPAFGAAGSAALWEVFDHHPDPAFRAGALATACNAPNADVAMRVRAAFSDPEPAVRAAAVACAARLPREEAAAAVAALGADADERVRARAGQAQAVGGDARGIAVLAQVASDPTADVDARARAMHGLVNARACGEIGRLRELALDPSRTVSLPANAALWSLHMPCGSPDRSQAELGQIHAALSAGGARAVAAAESIGGSDASDAMLAPTLIACLSDAAPNLRAAAVSALSRMGPRARAATPTLVGLLRDPSESVRRRAIIALGRIGPDVGPEAVAALRALRDDGTVSHEVRDALAQIEGGQR